MKATRPQPEPADEAADRAKPGAHSAHGTVRSTAFGEWMMGNVRREIAAGRVRQTIDERGVEHAIN